MIPARLFQTSVPGIERPLTKQEGSQLYKYLILLTKWQKSQRLVGSTEMTWLAENVVLDSIRFLAVIPSSARVIADVGSGAGIPGIPIAIVRPEIEIALIEARQRRVSFLSTAVRELGLTTVRVEGARVEDLSVSHADRFDSVVMRCAGRVDNLRPKVYPILRPGGVLVVSSGPNAGSTDGERVLLGAPGVKDRSFWRFVKPHHDP